MFQLLFYHLKAAAQNAGVQWRLKNLGPLFLIFSLFASSGIIAQEKNQSAFRVRIYIGGFGVFETRIENDESIVVRRDEVFRNGKQISKIGELVKNGFTQQLRNENRNARLSYRLREVQLLAFNQGGIRDTPNNLAVDFEFAKTPDVKISEERISDVSVQDGTGNILFCGYLGSQITEFRITDRKLVFIQGPKELASFNSVIECAKVVNTDETHIKSTLEPLADWVSQSQFSRFASTVVLRDKKDEVCWWLAECEFRSMATNHLLRMMSTREQLGKQKGQGKAKLRGALNGTDAAKTKSKSPE